MLKYFRLSNYFLDIINKYNGDVHCEMIDPDEHKARFLKYCSDPVVPEEELQPYDDYTYPIPMIEEK